MCSRGRVLAKDPAHEGTPSSLKMKGIHRIAVNPLHVLTPERFCRISGSVTEKTRLPDVSPCRLLAATRADACRSMQKGGQHPDGECDGIKRVPAGREWGCASAVQPLLCFCHGKEGEGVLFFRAAAFFCRFGKGRPVTGPSAS